MIKWLQAKIQNKIGELYIYGDIEDWKFIDEDVTPAGVADEIKKLEDAAEVNIYVNSPGGSVFAGVAIYNEIKRLNKPTTAYIDGLAASIASLIVLAADRVVMPFNAMLMIHNPWTCACGDANALRELADKIDRIKDGVLVSTYENKTGLEKEKLAEMMDAETWLTGPEALELGFADEVEQEQKIAACYQGENVLFDSVEVQLNKFRSFPKSKFTEHKPPQKMSLANRHRHKINMLSAHN